MQLKIPTFDLQSDGRVFVWFGSKEFFEYANMESLRLQMDDMIGDEKMLFRRLAMLLARRRPASRGKTLTIDPDTSTLSVT
jgi:hypothetical protein